MNGTAREREEIWFNHFVPLIEDDLFLLLNLTSEYSELRTRILGYLTDSASEEDSSFSPEEILSRWKSFISDGDQEKHALLKNIDLTQSSWDMIYKCNIEKYPHNSLIFVIYSCCLLQRLKEGKLNKYEQSKIFNKPFFEGSLLHAKIASSIASW